MNCKHLAVASLAGILVAALLVLIQGAPSPDPLDSNALSGAEHPDIASLPIADTRDRGMPSRRSTTQSPPQQPPSTVQRESTAPFPQESLGAFLESYFGDEWVDVEDRYRRFELNAPLAESPLRPWHQVEEAARERLTRESEALKTHLSSYIFGSQRPDLRTREEPRHSLETEQDIRAQIDALIELAAADLSPLLEQMIASDRFERTPLIGWGKIWQQELYDPTERPVFDYIATVNTWVVGVEIGPRDAPLAAMYMSEARQLLSVLESGGH
jgi:hypothetical protein